MEGLSDPSLLPTVDERSAHELYQSLVAEAAVIKRPIQRKGLAFRFREGVARETYDLDIGLDPPPAPPLVSVPTRGGGVVRRASLNGSTISSQNRRIGSAGGGEG